MVNLRKLLYITKYFPAESKLFCIDYLPFSITLFQLVNLPLHNFNAIVLKNYFEHNGTLRVYINNIYIALVTVRRSSSSMR